MKEPFVYKLTTDNGGAPCVTSDLLSLAICKPNIRSKAALGDWIFGFGDNDGLGGRLIYIAEVTGKLTNAAYYSAEIFARRHDCIYQFVSSRRLDQRPGAIYHGTDEDLLKDVGEGPLYSRANVLLSTNFRYFGKIHGPEIPDAVATFIKSLGQGHRRQLPADVKRGLLRVKENAWEKFHEMKVGTRTHTDLKLKCNS